MLKRVIWVMACVLAACSGEGDALNRTNNVAAGSTAPAAGTNAAGAPQGGAGTLGFHNPSTAGSDTAAGTGTPPEAGVESQPPGGECGTVTQMAENKLQSVDIIIGVDTSGSMAEEVAEVQANLNAFSQQIIDSGIDVSVILLSGLQGSALVPLTVDGPCIAAPLGSGSCPNDSNPPVYVHVDTPVGSWDVLDVYINAYPSYREYLREDSLKTFVSITDDNATSPFGAEPPVINTGAKFVSAVESLEPPGSNMWSSWRYSGIYCFTQCPFASLIGTVHQELVSTTQGVGGDLCLQDFAPVFDALAQQVAEVVTLACDWEIPPPPAGETFDAGETNVQVELDGTAEILLKAPDASSCGDQEGWHYDDETTPTNVVACPSTCARIQAAASARVDLLFGCETMFIPLD